MSTALAGEFRLAAGVYHYLESLDSVSAPWTPEPGAGKGTDLSSARHVQIFAEIVMALALGRVVAVPQSYAFDSWGFLDVASRMLAARPASGERDHPFALHLFGAATFDQAIGQMLERITNQTNPFFSSLIPKINDASEPCETVPTDVEALMQSEWLADDAGNRRADALQSVRAEFAGRPRVPARPRPGNVSLGQAIADFTARPITDHAGGADSDVLEVHGELVAGLLRLDPSRPAPFSQRSRLRTGAAWPNDPAGRLPEEVAGGIETLELVIEFVDTVYNAIVARSIGVAPVTFTTDLARADRSLAARAIAQDFAVGLIGAQDLGDPLADGGLHEYATEGPQFELKVRASRRLSEEDVQAEMKKLLDRASGDGIAHLLAQRAATGRGPGLRSPFWIGLDRYHSALRDGNQLAARRALEKHLQTVARTLGHGTDAGMESGWRPQLILGTVTATGAAGPMLAAVAWHLSSPAAVALTASGAVAPMLTSRITARVRQQASDRRLFYALGRTLERM